MKKIAQIVLVIILLSGNAFGQAFQKGNWNVDAGVGIGAYGTTTTLSIPLPFLGTVTSTANDGAVSVIVPVGVEYGISNKFGLGVHLGFSNYFLEDSTEVKNFFTGEKTGAMQENNTKSVKSVDFAIKFNLHLLNAEKNDLFVGLALGTSSITWDWKDIETETLKGSGGYASLYIMDRIFFSDHIGMFFNLGYTTYNYTNVESSTSSNNAINSLKWNAKGVNLGAGLALKF